MQGSPKILMWLWHLGRFDYSEITRQDFRGVAWLTLYGYALFIVCLGHIGKSVLGRYQKLLIVVYFV